MRNKFGMTSNFKNEFHFILTKSNSNIFSFDPIKKLPL
jgi:hypothetical protein